MKPSESFIEQVSQAGSAVIACLRASLLEVGAVCESSGLAESDFPGFSGHVYTALMQAWRAGEKYDLIKLMFRLRQTGVLVMAGGATAVSDTVGASATPQLIRDYIRMLLEARAARAMYELGSRLTSRAFDPATDVQALLEEAQKELSAVNARAETTHRSVGYFARQIVKDLEEPERHRASENIDVGLGLDEGAGPFERGDLMVVAGLTKGGKSSLAGNLIEYAATHGRRCAMFSFEMSGKQNVSRMLASQSSVNIRDLRSALNADPELFGARDSREMYDLGRIRQAAERVDNWKVEIFERLKGIDQVTSEMARMKAMGGLDVAMIDYAQLVRGLRSKGESREREVASISGEFKNACMRNECLGILLSQLTVDGNGAAHLRESRALGQDANCILFIEGEGEEKGLRVVAARSAPSGGVIDLRWEEQYTRFSRR